VKYFAVVKAVFYNTSVDCGKGLES